jgi:hypothetical protein
MNRWIPSMGLLSLAAIFFLAATWSGAAGALAQQHNKEQENPYEFSPARLDFGQQLVDSQSGARTSLLQNKSNKPRNFIAINVEGQNPTDFKVTNNCGSFLAPGTSCAVHVAFSPKDVGLRGAAVRVTDSFGLNQTLAITGLGIQPPPPPPPPVQGAPPPSS